MTTGNKNNRRNFIRQTAKGGLAALSLTTLGGSAVAFSEVTGKVSARIKPDHVVRSVPENMVFGYYGADVPAVARVKDGDIVEIQTINTTGISKSDPEAFFKRNNFPLDTEHAQDVINIIKNVKPDPGGLRGHMLTGPVFIEGAEPGDMMEIRVLDILIRSEYGVNSVWPHGGGLPDAVTQAETFVYKYNNKKTIATCDTIAGVDIPIKPFFGVMALSPPAELGRVSSIPPGFYGGNFDIRYLTKGSTLYLPVSVAGGMFTTGDCHVAEGNGEVSGVSIEASLTLIAKFIVHKGKAPKMARAETPTHFIAIGVDPDLREAMKNAITEATGFIKDELGYTFNQALSICSVGVDFEVSQVVNRTVGVHAMIPKSIFTGKKFKYWA
ncbi:MAG: Acetamidase/Formamidase [Mucilaginibacter sp.]|nr:Acetamidase/Formamidase [Mucilaginibacter sp.]